MPTPEARPNVVERRAAALGGPTPRNLMRAAGEVLREAGGRVADAERALAAIPPAQAASVLEGLDLAAVGAELARAANDAFEAYFAEDAEERATFAGVAMRGLEVRDEVACLLWAARRRVALGDAAGLGEAITTLEERLGECDARRASLSRQLTGVNAERRAALARLAEPARAEAWWLTDRADDDELLGALAGTGAPATPTAAADLLASSLPAGDARLGGALSRAGFGSASPGERALLERAAASDPELSAALSIPLE